MSGAPKHTVYWFKWIHPARDCAGATRELTARLVVQMIFLATTVVAGITIWRCLLLIIKWHADVGLERAEVLIQLTIFVAYVIWRLFFQLNPFADTLVNSLTAEARLTIDRPGADDLDLYLQLAVFVFVMPLVAMTSGFIVAKDLKGLAVLDDQLDDLTSLLFPAAILAVLFMVMQGIPLFWAASLLPQGKDSEGALVQQLAVSLSINFGFFAALLLAALHVPAVWVVNKKHSAELLTDTKASTAQYYVRFATVLSPILAGIPLAKLLSMIFG